MAHEEKPKEVITITDNSNRFEEILSFYSKKMFSDIDIILNGQKIPSHKMVLAARSEYFKTLLTADASKTEIIIGGVSPKVFRKLLKYIYTGSLSLVISEIDTIFDVIDLAGRFGIKSLQVAIGEELSTLIDLENVFNILNKANLYDMDELRNVCLSFMDENSSEILQSDLVKNLTQKSMVTLFERDSFKEPEIEIFKCVAKWCSSNNDENNLVIQTVRLNCLTNEEIIRIVRPTKLVDDEKIFSVLDEILNGIPEAAKPRVTTFSGEETNLCSLTLQCFNTDLCSPLLKAKFISGINTDILLMQNQSTNNYAYHNVDDKNGITLRFTKPYYINHVCIQFWEGQNSNDYSYYIEVSQNKKIWNKVVDYSTYRCRSIQNVSFETVEAKYIRLVGTFSSVANALRITGFKVYLQSLFTEMIDGIVCADLNVSLIREGAAIIMPKKIEGSEYLLSYTIDSDYFYLDFMEECIVQLAQPYIISDIALIFDNMGYTFLIQTSVDNVRWTSAVDFQNEAYRARYGTFSFEARPTLFIKIIGFGNSHYNARRFRCKNLQCYWTNN